MSRFLKFIVNTFLIAAILVAAAILVPLVAGVRTTIVDSPSMDTNLPLGSITYATDVDVAKLRVGDEILKDNNISTYAYIIRSGDETTGRFKVVSATDPNGKEEEIILRNTVPKVAVVVPYIGYLMIAMHSVEGIIIVALVIILVIILFILSELWKPRDEDDDEDQEAVVSAGLTDGNPDGIDTEVIRETMEANVAAVSGEGDDAEEAQEEEEHLTWSERRARKRAAKKARKQAAKEQDDEAAESVIAGGAAAASGSAPGETAEAAREAGRDTDQADASAADASRAHAAGSVTAETEAADGAADSAAGAAADAAEAGAEAEAAADAAGDKVEAMAAGAAEAASDAAGAAGEAAGEAAKSAGETAKTAAEEAAHAGAEAAADAAADAASSGDGLPVIDESVLNFQEEKTGSADDGVRPLEQEAEIGFAADRRNPGFFDEPAGRKEDEAVRFTPVRRPNLTEMLDQAKVSGENPGINEDRGTGVTIVDYSDLI